MALLSRHSRREVVQQPISPNTAPAQPQSAMVEERSSASSSEGANAVLRGIAAAAGGVVTVVGIVALIRIDWVDGLSSPPSEVLGMAFTPAVAIATTVIGLIALVAGAAADKA
jgi:hypothetical protein